MKVNRSEGGSIYRCRESLEERSEDAICDILENVGEMGQIVRHASNEKARKCSNLLQIERHGCFGDHR